MTNDLTDRASHFEFGRNWAEYAKLIDENRLKAAEESLLSLHIDINGKSMIDIGSGSGLFSLAALRLGAKYVFAIDIDENSVATTRRVLSTFGSPEKWSAERISVFDLSPSRYGTFDLVYSWGVLHHTGDMWAAITSASEMVSPNGTFAIALYEWTPLCFLWKREKHVYSKAPRAIQIPVQYLYLAAYSLGSLMSGRNPFRMPTKRRGMNYMHDIHDWLGGYPYESTSPEKVNKHLVDLKFDRVLVRQATVRAFGLFGSGCSEYVYRRSTEASIC
jgi:SAM-dependent methyltransferase